MLHNLNNTQIYTNTIHPPFLFLPPQYLSTLMMQKHNFLINLFPIPKLSKLLQIMNNFFSHTIIKLRAAALVSSLLARPIINVLGHYNVALFDLLQVVILLFSRACAYFPRKTGGAPIRAAATLVPDVLKILSFDFNEQTWLFTPQSKN